MAIFKTIEVRSESDLLRSADASVKDAVEARLHCSIQLSRTVAFPASTYPLRICGANLGSSRPTIDMQLAACKRLPNFSTWTTKTALVHNGLDIGPRPSVAIRSLGLANYDGGARAIRAATAGGDRTVHFCVEDCRLVNIGNDRLPYRGGISFADSADDVLFSVGLGGDAYNWLIRNLSIERCSRGSTYSHPLYVGGDRALLENVSARWSGHVFELDHLARFDARNCRVSQPSTVLWDKKGSSVNPWIWIVGKGSRGSIRQCRASGWFSRWVRGGLDGQCWDIDDNDLSKAWFDDERVSQMSVDGQAGEVVLDWAQHRAAGFDSYLSKSPAEPAT